MKYVLSAIVILLTSCANDEMTPSSGVLEGKWVEQVKRKDTLIFDSKMNGNDARYFVFRGSKSISGYNTLYSAVYEYKLNSDRIFLYNTVSSCYCFSDYSFEQRDGRIFIENFYDSNSTGEIEAFEKVN